MDDNKDQDSIVSAGNQSVLIKRIIWFNIALDIFIIDQISKWWITETILRPKLTGENGLNLFEWYANTPAMLSYISIKMTSFFNVIMAWNTGVSFSMFSNAGPHMPSILIGVALCITILFSVWLMRETRHSFGVCYALVIGGALGNIVDRARFGAVIDFLDFHIYGYHWPAFNVADMAVVIGVCLLVIVSLSFDIKEKRGYRV